MEQPPEHEASAAGPEAARHEHLEESAAQPPLEPEPRERDRDRDDASDDDRRRRRKSVSPRRSDNDSGPRGDDRGGSARSSDRGARRCCLACSGKSRDNGRCCVCLVPTRERRMPLGPDGCKSCGCQGCYPDDVAQGLVPPPGSRSRGGGRPPSPPRGHYAAAPMMSFPFFPPFNMSAAMGGYGAPPPPPQQGHGEQLKHGCCKQCMKKFSESGRACLCQVPSQVRRTEMPPQGCKICGCRGCHPDEKEKEVGFRGLPADPAAYYDPMYGAAGGLLPFPPGDMRGGPGMGGGRGAMAAPAVGMGAGPAAGAAAAFVAPAMMQAMMANFAYDRRVLPGGRGASPPGAGGMMGAGGMFPGGDFFGAAMMGHGYDPYGQMGYGAPPIGGKRDRDQDYDGDGKRYRRDSPPRRR